jgi:heptosyltransferase I
MRHSLPLARSPHSLCVLRLSAIGDVCHTLAVVRSLQAAWPATRITWIIGKLESGLVADIPDIEFIVYDKASGREGLVRLRQSLQDRHFDVLLQMQPSLRATRVARQVSADIRLGFDFARAQDFQWLFTSHRIASRERQHVLDGLFGFAEALGVKRGDLRWDIPLTAEDQAFALQHIPDGTGAMIISPLASLGARGARNWPAERFAAVARHAREKHKLKIILSGGPYERERECGAAIEASLGANVTNLIGHTSLKQLLALIARARLLLGPDSGPGHMSTTVNTPVISLFAGTNPDRAAPYLSRQWAVNKYPQALRADCGKAVEDVKWGRRVRNPDAMLLIGVEDVTAMLDRLMAEPPAPGA